MYRTAVVGSQKRSTRCYRELDLASQQHKKVAKSLILLINIYICIDMLPMSSQQSRSQI